LKKKILIISDHALSPSGVGVQTKFLVDGLLKKGDMTFIQLGGAVKHNNYNTVKVSDDFFIKPIDGFGNKTLLRSVLLNEKPDALLIFTDPRFFTWLFEMEDEIHQVCPILWWHVWDNRPTPRFNDWMYSATDAINCHSYLTYLMCKENFADKTSFIPHAVPNNLFYRMSDEDIQKEKSRILGEDRKDNFTCLWMNRNCRRKRPADVLYAWDLFLKKLNDEKRQSVTLIMHTDPEDKAGNNLFEVGSMLNLLDTVAFSTSKVDQEFMNIIHNISDVTINISYNEGFGLTTLESMQVGTPIIATKTGGLYRQVVDYRDGSINGVALDPKIKTIVGTQNIPYLFEDYIDVNDAAEALLKMFRMSKNEKKLLSKKVENYVKKEFSYEKTIDLWHESLIKTIKEFKCQRAKSSVELVNLAK
jgi:glycosyltransferase involved in cell wall biosynthesis